MNLVRSIKAMRELFFLFVFVTIMGSCGMKQSSTDNSIVERFECGQGLMKSAWHEHGADESVPTIHGLKSDFLILVDTNLRATNFISFDESFSRMESATLDTSDLHWIKNWDNYSVSEKFRKLKEEREKSNDRADSIHRINNQGQQQVWIINNSEDTVKVQMQDWLFICVLQAKTRNGQWCPIEYWRFSNCGNSYYHKVFPPKTANSFITRRLNEGDFNTQMRYKLLGTDRFFYSNEFEGKINYCRFVEDSSRYDEETKQPHYKLDSLIHQDNRP